MKCEEPPILLLFLLLCVCGAFFSARCCAAPHVPGAPAQSESTNLCSLGDGGNLRPEFCVCVFLCVCVCVCVWVCMSDKRRFRKVNPIKKTLFLLLFIVVDRGRKSCETLFYKPKRENRLPLHSFKKSKNGHTPITHIHTEHTHTHTRARSAQRYSIFSDKN